MHITRNRIYARQFLNAARLRRFSRAHGWSPVSLTEMKAFISVVLNMGLIRKSTIADYWSQKHDSQSTPWFRKVMSRNRFQLILKFFHIVDNHKLPPRNDPAYKPDLKFRPLLQFANRVFQRHYVPNREVCVDETLVATRGRTAMLQYIPTKAAKFGVKFWVLAESASGYVMRMKCYLGRQFEAAENGLQGTNVVVNLLRGCDLLQKGYHVVCDSFFCSIDLARTLLNYTTYITGTLRSNRVMPNAVKTAQPEPGTTYYMRQGKILLAVHRNAGRERRKPVRLLSTTLEAREVDNIPNIAHCYNHNMGGVDCADMLLSFYNGERKTIKVWKKMAIHIIQRMLLNAYILYSKNTSDRTVMTRHEFMKVVVESLSAEHLRQRVCTLPRRRCVGRVVPSLRPIAAKRTKDCVVCSNRQRARRRSRQECTVCQRGCHVGCWRNHICAEE